MVKILILLLLLISCKQEEVSPKVELPVTKNAEHIQLSNGNSQEFKLDPTPDCDKKAEPLPENKPVDLTKKPDEGCSLK
ncbi:MAG: hypothetical protein U0T83_10900 [Bacteriovoracaceae bacterium]